MYIICIPYHFTLFKMFSFKFGSYYPSSLWLFFSELYNLFRDMMFFEIIIIVGVKKQISVYVNIRINFYPPSIVVTCIVDTVQCGGKSCFASVRKMSKSGNDVAVYIFRIRYQMFFKTYAFNLPFYALYVIKL